MQYHAWYINMAIIQYYGMHQSTMIKPWFWNMYRSNVMVFFGLPWYHICLDAYYGNTMFSWTRTMMMIPCFCTFTMVILLYSLKCYKVWCKYHGRLTWEFVVPLYGTKCNDNTMRFNMYRSVWMVFLEKPWYCIFLDTCYFWTFTMVMPLYSFKYHTVWCKYHGKGIIIQ